jgi:hypothetical protein
MKLYCTYIFRNGGMVGLNVELDLKSLFVLHVNSCTHWIKFRNSPPPPVFGLIYEAAIGQPR